MLDILAFIQTSLAVIGVSPFFFHWYKMKQLSKEPLVIPPEPEIWPSLTVVLPVWNEEIVLKRKLEDLEKQHYPSNNFELVVIDSHSSDSTLVVLDDWKLSRQSKFKVSTIIMNQHLGKSAAINRVLKEKFTSDVLIITDADALLGPDSLKRIGRWFSDGRIGAVCGSQQIIGNDSEEHKLNEIAYRSFYHELRIGESSFSSTPIFEGSLAAFRYSLIAGKQIDSTYNADDSQLSLLVHGEGGKSIMDSELRFFESLPSSRKTANIRRLRRASGLVHLFSRNSANNYDSTFSKIFRKEAWAHLFMPFFVIFSIISMIGHIIFSTFSLLQTSILGNLHISLLLIDSLFLLLFLMGNKIRFGRILRSFLVAQWTLFLANIEMLQGKDRRYWKQDIESRNSIIRETNE